MIATQSQLNEPTRRKSGLAALLCNNRWLQLLEIVIVFSPVLMVLAIFRSLQIENQALFIGAIWTGNVIMLGLIGLGIKLRGESWPSIGLRFRVPGIEGVVSTIWKSLLIVVFAVAAFMVGAIVMANLVGIPQPADMTQYRYLQGNLPLLVISLIGVYIASSFGEEVVYRGFLITRLEALFGKLTRHAWLAAVLSSSLIFGFAHFEWGAMGIGQTTCMGAALAISFLWTKRNLWPLVLAHAYMDSLLLIPLYLAPASGG